MQAIAENLWTLEYHLPLLGTEQGRVVTIIRLQSGDLVIHSTGPFAVEDVRAIRNVGNPRWLVEAMLLHDTFAKVGREAFPDLPYLAPEGFSDVAGIATQSLLPPPPEWGDELEVLLIDGMPKFREHLFFHLPTRTLIVADFVFNFDHQGSAWERFFRRFAIGLKHQPNMSRPFRLMIQDKAAFDSSIERLMQWDFDRIIVGHKDVIETGGKEKVRRALVDAGLR